VLVTERLRHKQHDSIIYEGKNSFGGVNNPEIPTCPAREEQCDLSDRVMLSIVYKKQTKWHPKGSGRRAVEWAPSSGSSGNISFSSHISF
jgi:hypothetical protein